MDSTEIVAQEPVSTLPDSISDGPIIGDGLLAVTVEALKEPEDFLSKPEAAAVFAEQDVSVRESPATVQFQEETNKTDGNGNVEKVVDSSISAARASPDAVVVQQIMDAIEIEVDLTTAATNVDSSPHEGTLVVVSNMQEEAGHEGLLAAQADGKSNGEEISVVVVLDDVRHPVSEAQLSSLGDGGSDLGEVLASVELIVESAEVGTVEGSNNVANNGDTLQSSQPGNAGHNLEIETVVVSAANNTVNSTAIPLVDEQGTAGAEEAGRKEISSTTGLEQTDVEVMSDPAGGRIVSIMEESASDLRLEEEAPIEEPQLLNNSEGEILSTLMDYVAPIKLPTGHASAAARRIPIEELISVAIFEEALDHSTVDLNNFDAPEPESSEAVTAFDQRVDIPAIAEEQNGSDSSSNIVVERESAERDSKRLVMPDSRDTCAEERLTMRGLGGIAEITSITTTDELTEANVGTTVVDETGEELPLTRENVGLTDISEVGDIPMATRPGEREELSNSEQITVNETSCVDVVEAKAILGPTQETNVEVRLSTDKVETSLETATESLNQIPEGRIEDPQENTSKIETAPGETLIQAVVETFEEDTGVKNPEERTEEQQPAITFQEMIPNVTKEAGESLGETMDNVINAVDPPVVEKGQDTEMVDPPAAKQEGGEVVAITESMLPEDESGATTGDDLIDAEGCRVAIEETIDTIISITTIQHDSEVADAEIVDSHGVLIGVGSSVESSGLTITEIADTTVTVEEFQVEQQSVWSLSEPLITPPEEEIIEAIGDLCAAVDDIVDNDEPTQSIQSLVLVLTEDDARNESNDMQTSPDKEIQIPPDTTTGTQNSKHAAQSAKGVALRDTEQQTTSDTVVVDMAEPLDLPDEHILLPCPRETEMGTADIAAAWVSPPLTTPPENTQPTGIVAENIAQLQGLEQGRQDEIPTIAAAVDLRREEQDASVPNKVVSSEAHFAETTVEDGTSLAPAFESRQVSISMSSCGEEKLSSIHESATAIVGQDTTIEGDASDVVALITNELGFGLKAAVVDNEARAMESAVGSSFAPVVEADMDGRSNEQVECALDGSAYVVVDGLEAVEALERNEKKRGREEEGVAVAEDTEKIPKAAKTSNGEISFLNDVEANDVKIGEDVQVDKKRSRAELEAVSANPYVSIQAKVQKTGIADDNAISQSGKVDTEEEADAEEFVDMEYKEESQQKSLNGAGQDSTAPRYKKRKIAMFLGYSGAGYQGMQKNPGAITIEGELEEALFRAGAIAESNYGQPQKLDWRRAARTDKGVSAVGQVVSGAFFIDPPGFIERVNSHLPKQIRVYGYKRATAGFSAKKLCDRRKYEYVLPVYAFDPTVHLDRVTAQAVAAAEKGSCLNETEIKADATKVSGPPFETEASVVIESETKETMTEESTGTLVEPARETVVSLSTDATNSTTAKIEEIKGSKSSNNGMSAITEEITTVTEIIHENVAASEALLETGVNLSPENEDTNEKASIAPVEILVQTKEVSIERTEVTVSEIETDLSAEDKREALDEKVKKSTYKFDEAEFNRLNRILSGFEGHHNFHNFTARTKATDPSANRYIISFGVENTFTINGIEFVRCSVVGQSFMLHQIRKMIGLAVAIMRGTVPESILATALRRDTKINVPMAPELGLFLEECYYSAYNRRFKATHEEMSLSSFSAEVNDFKKEFIYPHIGSTEARDSTFAMWLHSLNDRHYPDFVAAREAENLIKSQ